MSPKIQGEINLNNGAKTMMKEQILKIANKIINSQKEIKTLKDKKLLAIENIYLIHLQSKMVKLQNLDFDLVLHTLDDAGLLITENNTIETFNPKKHLKLIRA